MAVVVCPDCSMRVIARSDETCPSCKADLSGGRAAPYRPHQRAPETPEEISSADEIPATGEVFWEPSRPIGRIPRGAVQLALIGTAVGAVVLLVDASTRGGDLGKMKSMLDLARVLAIGHLVAIAVTVFRIWLAIQDGPTRIQAGAAAGFLFVPVFNLFWIFIAFWGFAKNYNAWKEAADAYEAQRGEPLPRMPEALALVASIIVVASVIPGLWFFTAPLAVVVNVIFLSIAVGGVNRLADLEKSERKNSA